MEKLEVRVNDDSTLIATKTGANVTMPWFIFNPQAGGHYATEADVEGWREVSIPDAITEI